MTDIQKAIDDLIDAADRLVNRKGMASADMSLVLTQSITRLERALEQAQKAMEADRPVIRDTRIVEVRGLCEELGELRCIASEMAKALRSIRDMLRTQRRCPRECSTCKQRWCPGRIAENSLREWEKWKEGRS